METSQKYQYFLGADECNNGGTGERPEIMVVTLSENPRHLRRRRFQKRRVDRIILDKPSFKGVKDYRFALIQREYIERFGSSLMKAWAIASLVNGLRVDTERALLCIDGDYKPGFKKDIVDFLKYYGGCMAENQLRYEIDADEKYHLVNRADEIAFHLYRMYVLNPADIEKYRGREVEIDLSESQECNGLIGIKREEQDLVRRVRA